MVKTIVYITGRNLFVALKGKSRVAGRLTKIGWIMPIITKIKKNMKFLNNQPINVLITGICLLIK
jgi:hypothetical protein